VGVAVDVDPAGQVLAVEQRHEPVLVGLGGGEGGGQQQEQGSREDGSAHRGVSLWVGRNAGYCTAREVRHQTSLAEVRGGPEIGRYDTAFPSIPVSQGSGDRKCPRGNRSVCYPIPDTFDRRTELPAGR